MLLEFCIVGKSRITKPVFCPKEDYAPEGVPLYQLTEELADNLDDFISTYIVAHEKMVENGYTDADLVETPSDLWFKDIKHQ